MATINDSDKRLYCLCNQVAYGKMIGCDNSKVGIIRVIKKKKLYIGVV